MPASLPSHILPSPQRLILKSYPKDAQNQNLCALQPTQCLWPPTRQSREHLSEPQPWQTLPSPLDGWHQASKQTPYQARSTYRGKVSHGVTDVKHGRLVGVYTR